MAQGILMNDIELGFAPMSAYHFKQLIGDKGFHENVFDSHIYIIAQRDPLTFNNFKLSDDLLLSFEIKQNSNPETVECILPIVQKNIAKDLSKSIQLRIHDRRNKPGQQIQFPFNGTQGFTIQEVDLKTNETKSLIWFSPDKLFQNFWKGHIQLGISKSFSKMLEYRVHYVGKSTEQNICERLSNHSTFQDILINQEPFTYGNIPSDEIMILLLRIKDNNSIVKWGVESSGKDISDFINNYVLPSDKTISLDAEKALIKHLQPGYNRILYDTFPNKADLVHQDFHNLILYSFCDPITLVYKHGIIKGDINPDDRDYVEVERK